MDFSSEELIDNYLLNRLSESDKAVFKQALATDPILRNKVAEQKKVIALLHDMEELLLLDRIRSISAKVAVNPQGKIIKKHNRFFYYGSIAAAILLLITVAYFAFIRPPLNERIYADNYKIYQLENLRGSTSKIQDIFQTGIRHYQAQDYQQASVAFKKIQTNHIEAKMALGICYLETNQEEKAILQFQGLEGTVFHNTAIWYQGLIYLKTNQIEKSLSYFNPLISEKNSYSIRSQTIVNQINK